MAVRSDCSASSGLTSKAGGVRRPARCRAASTSTISERREFERAADLLLAGIERAQPRFGVADPGLDAAHLGGDVDQLRIELAAVLADRRDIGLEFLLQFGRALLLRAGGFEFLLALLDGVGRSGRSPAAPALATWAAAGNGLMPSKARGQQGNESGMRAEAGRPRRAVSG